MGIRLGLKDIRESCYYRIRLNQAIVEDSKFVFVFCEVCELDRDDDPIILAEGPREAIPEVLVPQLAHGVWEDGVEDQPKRVEKIRLPDLVLADNYRVGSERDIELPKVAKILNTNT